MEDILQTKKYSRLALIPSKVIHQMVRKLEQMYPQYTWCRAARKNAVYFLRVGVSLEDAGEYLHKYEKRCMKKLMKNEIYPIGGGRTMEFALEYWRSYWMVMRLFFRGQTYKAWKKEKMDKLKRKWARVAKEKGKQK